MRRRILIWILAALLMLTAAACKQDVTSHSFSTPTQTPTAQTEPETPIYAFSDADIAAAEQTVLDYYDAMANRDAEKFIALMDPRFGYSMDKYNSGEISLWDEGDLLLLEILPYDAEFQRSFGYHTDLGDGNTIILRADFEVSFTGDNMNSCYNAGIYTDWAFVLVRDGAESPWRIYDQGY